MSQFGAFTPTGKTFLLTLNSAAPTDTAITAQDGFVGSQYMITNTSGTLFAYVSYSTTPAASNAAQALAVIPTAGTPQNVLPVPPNAQVVFSLPSGVGRALSMSGIMPSAGAVSVFVTPGEGL